MARHLEDDHQKALFEWADLFEQLRWLHAIPNGGRRNKREAARLKAQGVRSGVWDVFLPVVWPPYSGLYIEMKIKPNKLSALQTEFREHAEVNGYKCVVAFSWIEARDAIIEYMHMS